MQRIRSWIRARIFGKARHPRDFLLERMPTSSVAAEIGVFKGDFSTRILEVVKPRKLHLIDPWKYEEGETYRDSWYGGSAGENQAKMDAIWNSVLRRFQHEIANEQILVHRANSLEASSVFPQDYFDWVYIDGNHLYEFVKQDLEAYSSKLKPGGYMTGDDYDSKGWWQNGVTKAVDEFLATGACSPILIENGQFCLRKN